MKIMQKNVEVIELSKDEAIKTLVSDDIMNEDSDFITDILVSGFKGYANQSKKSLENELNVRERFDRGILPILKVFKVK